LDEVRTTLQNGNDVFQFDTVAEHLRYLFYSVHPTNRASGTVYTSLFTVEVEENMHANKQEK